MTEISNESGAGADETLRERARERLRQKGRTTPRDLSTQDARTLLEELQVHEFELQIQNEELQDTLAALAEARDRYYKLYNEAPVGYMTLDGDAITELNRAACDILGQSREGAVGMSFLHFVAPESVDAYYAHRQAVHAGTDREHPELELHNLAGQRWHVALRCARSGTNGQGGCHCALVDITERKQAEAHAKQLERDMVFAADQERARISRDLHDNVSQQIAALNMFAHRLQQRLEDEGSGEAETAADLGRKLQTAARDLRAAVYDLAAPELEQGKLGMALQELAAQTSRDAGVRCSCTGCESMSDVDRDTGIQLLHIAREAVHNAYEHGEATHIGIVVEDSEADLQLSIEDDGRGIDAVDNANQEQQSAGLGLRSMHYRARLLDARLRIVPRAGGGTVVHCTLPR